jgi:hypothetical protein
MSISEWQALCDALLSHEYASKFYYDAFASMLEWTDILENFTRSAPSTSRVSENVLGHIKYRLSNKEDSGEEEAETENVVQWKKENCEDFERMIPGIARTIGCDMKVEKHILAYCGYGAPLDLRFVLYDDEGHTECFRKGDLKGANNCCIM